MQKIIDNLKTLRNGLFKDEQAVIELIDETLKLVEQKASQFDALVIRFVGENEPLNVGKLKKIIADLDDDFTIDMRVRTRLTEEQLKNLSYPYPYNTEYTQLEFDDIGYSEKQLCLGCEIANKHV